MGCVTGPGTILPGLYRWVRLAVTPEMDWKLWYCLLPCCSWGAMLSHAARAPLQEHVWVSSVTVRSSQKTGWRSVAVRTSQKDAEIHLLPARPSVCSALPVSVLAGVHSWSTDLCHRWQLESLGPGGRAAGRWQRCLSSSPVRTVLGSGRLVLFC